MPSETVRSSRSTVYDAVAGRVTQSGVYEPTATEQKRATLRLRPDEVLFKQRRAPPRYEEADYYFAHRKLPSSQALPSSDLLSALHEYIAQLYDCNFSQDRKESGSWKSMDETALIAFGVLLEEAMKATLGERGHLALVEAEGSQEDETFVKNARVKEEEDGRGRRGRGRDIC
ncbi:hypothetical protein DPSP01_006406 [Paraphaeosphaeria sporulosa]|uniref:Uncharacterized protein n=1 Tax=Paraphaeosphaeria sporulosa TaxID=1460663 RepID=A0A177BWQ4_9PLEO|nr:uncharacterized protein CC84DRAFT_424178 [Paraphaeosphaeria sporulosa]OAF98749.1 hypothetical protein CC84DRAFT_424178 [Paraphaeosphaeria sporulosa]